MKTAIVTGGAKRLGSVIAKFLAGRGYQIALHYRTSEPAETSQSILDMGGVCQAFQADLASDLGPELLINRVMDAFSHIDVLVNCASIFEPGSIRETDSDLFDRHMRINFRAPFMLSRSLAVRCQSGHIINIIDAKINRNIHTHAIYILTKKMLYEFTKMAAIEFSPHFRVNAVAPGAILPPPGKDEAYLKQRAADAPLNKTGTPDDIVRAIGYLLDNDFITGECLNIDGGVHLK